MSTPCEHLATGLGELYSCVDVNGHTRIRTPFLYPDGDIIDLYLVRNANQPVLTDYGESINWLKSQTISQKKTVKQKRLIDDIALTHGIELYHGMLTLRVADMNTLSSLVTRLGQAAVRIADLWFTFRTRAVESVTDEVDDFLADRGIQHERGEPFIGRSGKSWRVDFHIRMPQRTSLVNVLSTGSQAAAGRIVDHVVANWYDLNHLLLTPQPLRLVSLFDDSIDIWTQENIRLVGDLSDIAYWSRPDEFYQLLAT
ncbi:MAG: hypothetical protein DMF61_05780 [Blastocatellia bacterium AA13]|nr:MAG: hypothetical protein DMF61_05780 [Blastocatellia bacterium AA13]